MKVFVLGGGDSPEREVSLRSAAAVAEAARAAGFEVQEKDPASGLDFLDDVDKSDIILPILHGKGGEDGVLQKELESRGLSFLGSSSASSERCFNKWLTRLDLAESGVLVPVGGLVSRATYQNHELSRQPHVLKVVHGGSSLGVLIARDPKLVTPDQIDEVFQLDEMAVIEELITGFEITMPVLDQTALTPIEIIPPEGREFDYENKYNDKSQELCPPVSVSLEIQAQAKKIAEKAHRTMKCSHLSRSDFMVGANRQIYFLEINVIPGLTHQSLFPKSAAVEGLSWPKLVSKFVALVKRDFNI